MWRGNMFKNKIFLLIVGVLLLAFLTVISGFSDILGILRVVNPIFLIGLAFLQVLTLSLTSFQWKYLLGKDVNDISFIDVFSINLSGIFIESATPSSKLGGEATKIYLFKRKTELSYKRLTSFLIVHKYLSVLPFLALCSLFLSLGSVKFTLPNITYISFGFLALLCALMIFIIHRENDNEGWNKGNSPGFSCKSGVMSKIWGKIKAGMDFICESAGQVKGILNKRELGFLILISLLIWVLYPFKVYLVTVVLGFNLNPMIPVIATYSAYLVSMLPITPGGLGTFEGTMALIFSVNGFSFTEGMAIAFLVRSITYWLPLFISAGMTVYLIKFSDISLLPSKIH